MVQKLGNKKVLIIAGVALGVVLLILAIIALAGGFNGNKKDPYKQPETTQPTNNSTETKPTDQTDEADKGDDSKNNSTNAPAKSTLDPATVSTITIEPMNIVVSYVKGIGGFEYAVKRTANGTQYVEFSSPELQGTKCTNDTGSFASILANPGSEETVTITKSVSVDGSKYGLSLTAANCTKDESLLKQYQQSFSDAFDLLKKQ